LIFFFCRIWGVYNTKVYDLTDYVNSGNLANNNPIWQFLDSDLVDVFKQRSGQDITKPMGKVLDRMNATARAQNMNCLENVFLAGQADFRKSARCQVQNYLLIIISAILMASIVMKCAFFLLRFC